MERLAFSSILVLSQKPNKSLTKSYNLFYLSWSKRSTCLFMKKLLLLTLFLPIALFAQTPKGNGAYKINLPSAVSSSDLSWKKAFLEDDSAHIWIGFGYHYIFGRGEIGLGKYANGNWTMFKTANSGILSNDIIDLAAGDSSDILIGTKGGLSIYNRKHSSWTNFTTGNSALPNNWITCLKKSGTTTWIGTNEGLVKWEQGTMTVFNNQNWGTGTNSVRHLDVSGNTVFVGTSEGLVEFKNGVWTLHQYHGAAFPVNRLCVAPQNIVYLYGDSGLYTFANGQIQPFLFDMECLYNLDLSHLKKGTALTVDPLGNVYFIPKQKPSNWLGRQDLYLYQIKEGEVKEMPFFGLSVMYNRDQFLGSGASGNIWVLDAMVDSIVLIKPEEYTGTLPLHLSPGKNFNNLDINKMDMAILNRGDMFWDSYERPSFEVPKGSCKNASFGAALWVGGMDAGQNLHVAAQTYRQTGNDFYPGPLDTVSRLGTTDENNPYNRIWKINRRDIVNFQAAFASGAVTSGAYVPSADFLEWPAHGTGNYSRTLAPFVDVNNDGKYDPFDGDYPKIRGDQMLFWIFNDNSAVHSETGGTPFGIEVHASAYAFNCNTIQDGDSDEVLNYSAFFHYKIINRSTNNYQNMYYANWMDADIGNYSDDFVGCNPEGNYMYGYNGDSVDEGNRGYGENPPMVNVLWLSDSMEHFMFYRNDFSVTGNPTLPAHYYGLMKAQWKDESQATYGGSGYQTGAPTNFMFPGNPYDPTKWNETSAGLMPGDRTMLSSVGNDMLPAGGVKELEYAVIFTREPNAPNGSNTSWAKNTADINQLKLWYSTNSFPTCDGVGSSIGDNLENAKQLSLYPNPGTNTFSIQLAGQQLDGAEIRVVDVTGRLVYETANTNGLIDASSWKAGIYFIHVVSGGASYSAKWVKVE